MNKLYIKNVYICGDELKMRWVKHVSWKGNKVFEKLTLERRIEHSLLMVGSSHSCL